MKNVFIRLIYIVSASLLFSGCQNTFTNLTPARIPTNPSGIYTISCTVNPSSANVVKGTLKASITIDGKTHPMRKSSSNSRVFTYDYVVPNDRTEAKYFFTSKYYADIKGAEREREMTSKLYRMSLTNKYVISMQSERGPVGTEIPIVGRGFREHDRVIVGDFEAETRFMSDVALSFFVPPLPAYETYPVTLKTNSGELDVGQFRIDPSVFTVTPSSISVNAGQETIILFAIQEPAPSGGLLIDVTTDIASSVIMPEVVIPSGARTVRIPIEGGQAGNGSLFINAPGFTEITIPIQVTGTLPKTVPNEIKSSISPKGAADLIITE